jgi:hypothetical protein
MTSAAPLPVEPELRALRAEIRQAAERLRVVTRSLRGAPTPRRGLRFLRGGRWPAAQ